MDPHDDTADLAALLAEHVAAVNLHVKRVRSNELPINHLYLAQQMTAIRQNLAALEAAILRERERAE